ncbi:hypothetical protein [Halogeometricum borinquense]|uniref:hypothetical protein n=1 Tax=Halogeometricum borinquense TaxID=60847 RepID=UPI0034286C13
MSPSRRTTLGLMGTGVVALLSGCSSVTGADGETATQPSRTDESNGGDDSASGDTTSGANTADGPTNFEIRLVGPVGTETDPTLFTDAEIKSVGAVEQQRNSLYGLPVTLTDEATTEVNETLQSVGVAENPDEFELVQRHDGEEVTRFEISRNLASKIAEGKWDGEFVLMFKSREKAAELRKTLTEG